MPPKPRGESVVAALRKTWRVDGQQRCDDACCKDFQCARCEKETAAAARAAKTQLVVAARSVAAIETVNQVPQAAVRVWITAIGSSVASDLANQKNPYENLDPSTLLTAAHLIGRAADDKGVEKPSDVSPLEQALAAAASQLQQTVRVAPPGKVKGVAKLSAGVAAQQEQMAPPGKIKCVAKASEAAKVKGKQQQPSSAPSNEAGAKATPVSDDDLQMRDESESDDGLPHDAVDVAFKCGDVCAVVDCIRTYFDQHGKEHVDVPECKVQSIRKCKDDGLVSKYTVMLPDGTLREVEAHRCYASDETALDVFEQLREQQKRRAGVASGDAPGSGSAPAVQATVQQAASLLHGSVAPAPQRMPPPAKGKGVAKPSPAVAAQQEPTPTTAKDTTAGLDEDDADAQDHLEQKQLWCFTTRMLAWKKIRERNPWAQSERMACWADCAADLRIIIDDAITATQNGEVTKENRVEPRYRLFLKGKDAKGQDKDGHALQNMFARHSGSAKAREAAEAQRSGHGDARGSAANKQDRANEMEEREILIELLSMQEQADLYKNCTKTSKTSLKSFQETQIHNAIMAQALTAGSTTYRKHLQMLANKKRELQQKVEILKEANAAMSEEDKATVDELLKALAELDEAKASKVPDSDSSRTGGRGGGKPKRGRADAFEDTMASLSAAALKLSQGRSEETPFEATMRMYMQHRMDVETQATAATATPKRSFVDDTNVEQELKKLKQWLDADILTQEAYNEAVSRVIGKF